MAKNMYDFYKDAYSEIKGKIPERPYLDKQMSLPIYEGYSVANLPASICNWLGSENTGMLPPLSFGEIYGDRFRHVILVIVDGLGAYQMEKIRDRLADNSWLQLISKYGIEKLLTSIVPSATAAALTSLWTGVSGGTHGLVGYETWMRSLGMVVNFLQYSPSSIGSKPGLIGDAGILPEAILPVPTLGNHLMGGGIISRSHMPIALAHSNLTRAQMAGVSVVPYRRFGDLWENVKELLEADREKVTFDSVYWNDLDTYNHLMGMNDNRIFIDLGSFFDGLARTVQALSRGNFGKTLVLVTADHGHIENTPDPNRDIKNHPELMHNLMIMPCGENRLTYFYPKSGKETAIRNYIEETWPDDFYLVSGQELIADGIFGTAAFHPDLDNRIGEWVAIARGYAYFWWPNRPDKLYSRHGGLSDQEMIVPLMGLAL